MPNSVSEVTDSCSNRFFVITAAALKDIFFPPLCHICRTYLPNSPEIHICEKCMEGIDYISSPLCTLCGEPFAGAGHDHLCGRCAIKPPIFDSARSGLRYTGNAKELIHKFKYTPKPMLGRVLALVTANCLHSYASSIGADLITPVPLHRYRMRERGFNQSLFVAEFLSKKWGVPLSRNFLARTKVTAPQFSLSSDERKKNVAGAFEINNKNSRLPERVILVDDVFTTGSTVAECARCAKNGGVKEVHVVTVARAVLS